MLITYQAKLIEKKELAPEIHSFVFSRPDDNNWTFKAGQYMIFHIPQDNTHAVRRLYSIASPPSQNQYLEFIIEYVPSGIASNYLDCCQENSQITFQGPAGVFVYKNSLRDPVFFATGTGIAPIYSIICDILEKNEASPKSIYLFWGLKQHRDLYYFDKLKQLAEGNPKFQFKLCFSRETDISSLFPQDDLKYCLCGRVNIGFESLLENTQLAPDAYDYYLCGAKHVVEGLREYLTAKNVPREDVFFEKFTT